MRTNKIPWSKRIYLPLLLACLPLSSCTPEKAKALRLGAVQFKTESISCIDSIENMHKRELESPPRSKEVINQEFINSLFLENDSNFINLDDIEDALDPNKVNLSKEVNKKWQDFISKLTLQYSSFAAIYDDLEAGSFLAQESVMTSEQYAKDLTIQMAYFANVINEYPPVLLQYRTNVAAEFTKLKRKYKSDPSIDFQTISVSAIALKDQWLQVISQENSLRDETVKQCLQAAVMGKELRPLIENYDQLDLDTINTIIAGIFNTVGGISGKDYSLLKKQSATLIAQIKNDPILNRAANNLFAQVEVAVKERNVGDVENNDAVNNDAVNGYWLDRKHDIKIAEEMNDFIKSIESKKLSLDTLSIRNNSK